MVIFVQLIQRYLFCARESMILQFTPSFLFSYFNMYCFLDKVIEIICSLHLLYFFPKFLMMACYMTAFYVQILVIFHDRPQEC